MMPRELYIGIMTGTSVDAVDVVIADCSQHVPSVLHHHSAPFDDGLRALIIQCADAENISIDVLARLHFLLAEVYATSVHDVLREANIPAQDIRAIGLHGQTVRHLPERKALIPTLPAVGATLQLGSGAALAALVGINVVSDFRSGDIALGGEGAPLVPMFDSHFMRSDSHSRFILNIGGIANITYLPIEGNVVAFDTGPGNMVMDFLSHAYFEKPYDEGGTIARAGTIHTVLLDSLLAHPYFSQLPPKSTGRELFAKTIPEAFLNAIREADISPEDAIATASELTSRTIAQAILSLQKEYAEVVVSGGGEKNTFLIERLQELLGTIRIISSDDVGIPSQTKEALAFAWFAKTFLHKEIIHLPKTTGASRYIILGSLSRGSAA